MVAAKTLKYSKGLSASVWSVHSGLFWKKRCNPVDSKRTSSRRYIKSGQSVRDGAPFSPMKAARWRLEAKKAQLPAYENIRIFRVLCGPQNVHTRDFSFSTRLT